MSNTVVEATVEHRHEWRLGPDDGEDAGALLTVHLGSSSSAVRSAASGLDVGVRMSRHADETLTESWHAGRVLEAGEIGGVRFARTGRILASAFILHPGQLDAASVRDRYATAFRIAAETGYDRLLRAWNFIGGILELDETGLERYRTFSVGRSQAFDEWLPSLGGVPAATGIGTQGESFVVVLLSSKGGRVRHVENPRQVSAYRYPQQYGPKPPTFARATYLDQPGGGTLFVSGTASILGDESVHLGDVRAQVEETLGNIAALIGPDNASGHGLGDGFALSRLEGVRAYVKSPAHVGLVRDLLRRRLGREPAVFVVDVCRPELLVEIEGLVRVQRHGAPRDGARS